MNFTIFFNNNKISIFFVYTNAFSINKLKLNKAFTKSFDKKNEMRKISLIFMRYENFFIKNYVKINVQSNTKIYEREMEVRNVYIGFCGRMNKKRAGELVNECETHF